MRRESQGGYATVETALTLPSLVAVAAIALGTGMVGAAKVQVCDAARAAARGSSIGESFQGPAGVTVKVDSTGQWVKATASKHLGGSITILPAVTCGANAIKEPELTMGMER